MNGFSSCSKHRVLFHLLIFATLTGGLAGCASKAELEQRRQNSYDVSGTYKTAKPGPGSEVDIGFEIANEQGRHDIVVTLERVSPLSEKERSFLVAKGIDPEKVGTYFGRQLVLGKGVSRDHLEGGENISDDFGESSHFYVCTERYAYDRQNELMYCLSGNARKGADFIEGQLALRLIKTQEKTENGQTSQVVSFDETALAYRTTAGLIFYKQYFGIWSGDVREFASGLPFGARTRLQIAAVPTAVAGSETAVTPAMFQAELVGVTRIDFAGEVFEYDATASRGELENLKVIEYPVIMVIFRSTQNPAHTISMVGVAWSLGDLSGAVLLDRDGRKTELATFRLKRQ